MLFETYKRHLTKTTSLTKNVCSFMGFIVSNYTPQLAMMILLATGDMALTWH